MVVSAIVLSCYGPAHADTPHPSREEWLEVYLTSKIRENTDAWEQRTAIRTVVDSNTRQIIITLTSANGQGEYSEGTRQTHLAMVKKMALGIVNKYDWAADYSVQVQFV